VTGIDLSPTMIAQAKQRAAAQGVAERCRFLVQDLALLDAGQRFDLILGVTVLQHILDPQALRHAMQRMVAHLAEGGTVILLEAAPNRAVENCDSSIFRARQRSAYLRLFADCGLRVRAISGVDPAPFKTWLWPYLPRLSQRLRTAALAVVTALSIPIDVPFGRRAVERSWHAVFILERARPI
jgi:SAM-dependent methyltransferase